MVRTLLLAMSIPQYLWCDAVLTATYLVNRLPSAALGGAIPLQRLTPAADIFSLPPRVFGCTAFVQYHSPGLSKLAPRAQKGVFVGYSRTQKGYRVYFPDRRQYVTSADVTFHEDVPYFPSTQPGEDLSSPSLLPSVSATIVTDLPMTVSIPLLEASLTCHFCASLKHKDDGQTKFIKPNSQRQDIIIKYWVSIGSNHIEQG